MTASFSPFAGSPFAAGRAPEALTPEDLSAGDLQLLQTARLSATLRHAYDHSPVQRAKMQAAGLSPDDFRAPEDLRRFPFTTKADMRGAYPFGLFAVPREQILRLHASSGTTGKPTVVGYTAEDLEVWTAVMARAIRAAGGRPGDLAQNAFGYGLFTGGLGFHYGAERLGCTVVPVSGGMTERQVTLMHDFRPRLIFGTPSYMLSILDEFARRGLDPRGCGLEIGIFGGEPWTEALRAEIESGFGIAAQDNYGLSEIIGPGVAIEKAGDQGALTIWEDLFYPEIIDPDTGAPLPDGAAGELVLTTLANTAMPMIRYRTRDLTRLLPGKGSAMRRMEKVRGRSDDMIILRGVNVFPTQIESQLVGCAGLAPHFQIELSRPQRMDAMAILAEALPAHATPEARRQAGRDLAHRIKSTLGLTVEVRVGDPGSLPRSEGKARRVIDLRPKD